MSEAQGSVGVPMGKSLLKESEKFIPETGVAAFRTMKDDELVQGTFQSVCSAGLLSSALGGEVAKGGVLLELVAHVIDTKSENNEAHGRGVIQSVYAGHTRLGGAGGVASCGMVRVFWVFHYYIRN
ncbi:hypothetical protein CEY00_Acc29347 [Actinidia chinensis var. chinensis]|uniref:Uncharacterized protein n=1 Tax=Actinidia chinensis var. chinensis TaxID=1590841 RepID=A0A2R6PCM8_ACTCC|nr:hypothetical protein CEY00_Acc29347 [Actinidia chinensis var. chinensis]